MRPAPDDALLHAWLDGELLPAQRAEIEAWLDAHPQDAARVRLWAADGDALRAQFDRVLDEPIPASLAATVGLAGTAAVSGADVGATPRAASHGAFGGWQRWAAAVAVFVLGGAVGAALMWRAYTGPQALARLAEPAWVRRAAVAHAVYVPEVRHAVEVKAQEEHLSRWLTKRLDVPVKLFDLREHGFELVGGRLLPDANGPSAQLMYQATAAAAATTAATTATTPSATAQAPAGTPAQPTGATATASASAPTAKPVRVTVYLRKPESSALAAFRYEQQGELGMFYWVEGNGPKGEPCGYALVGALPREQLLALAESIYRQVAASR